MPSTQEIWKSSMQTPEGRKLARLLRVKPTPADKLKASKWLKRFISNKKNT
uniref:Uncharacterized protein n=1 Tax=viral metagenome TaxID=1070528 RepID=A0A6C0KC74_9ZZZZ